MLTINVKWYNMINLLSKNVYLEYLISSDLYRQAHLYHCEQYPKECMTGISILSINQAQTKSNSLEQAMAEGSSRSKVTLSKHGKDLGD